MSLHLALSFTPYRAFSFFCCFLSLSLRAAAAAAVVGPEAATTEAALDAKCGGWFKLATASGDMPRRSAVAGETAFTRPLAAYLTFPASPPRPSLSPLSSLGN